MQLRPVKQDEAHLLSQLSIRSKAHWGYDNAFMDASVEELSHSNEDLRDRNRHYVVAEVDNEVVGFYTLEDIDKAKITLLALFIDPDSMGLGIGKALFEDAKGKAADFGAQTMEIQSDPNAETFYQKMGAVTVGELASGSIEGRFLPLMQVKIS